MTTAIVERRYVLCAVEDIPSHVQTDFIVETHVAVEIAGGCDADDVFAKACREFHAVNAYGRLVWISEYCGDALLNWLEQNNVRARLIMADPIEESAVTISPSFTNGPRLARIDGMINVWLKHNVSDDVERPAFWISKDEAEGLARDVATWSPRPVNVRAALARGEAVYRGFNLFWEI